MPELGELVVIRWFDAWSDHDETSADDWENDCVNLTVGWVTRITNEAISISQEILPGDKYRCTTHIPWKIVDNIERTIYGSDQETPSDEGDRAKPVAAGCGHCA